MIRYFESFAISIVVVEIITRNLLKFDEEVSSGKYH